MEIVLKLQTGGTAAPGNTKNAGLYPGTVGGDGGDQPAALFGH